MINARDSSDAIDAPYQTVVKFGGYDGPDIPLTNTIKSYDDGVTVENGFILQSKDWSIGSFAISTGN